MPKMAILTILQGVNKAKWSKMADLESQSDSAKKQREHTKSGGIVPQSISINSRTILDLF